MGVEDVVCGFGFAVDGEDQAVSLTVDGDEHVPGVEWAQRDDTASRISFDESVCVAVECEAGNHVRDPRGAGHARVEEADRRGGFDHLAAALDLDRELRGGGGDDLDCSIDGGEAARVGEGG